MDESEVISVHVTHRPTYQCTAVTQGFTDFPSKLSFRLAAENPVFFFSRRLFILGKDLRNPRNSVSQI